MTRPNGLAATLFGAALCGLLAGCGGETPSQPPAKPPAPSQVEPGRTRPGPIIIERPGPAEVKPVKPKPVEPKPVEVKPVEAKPVPLAPGEMAVEIESFTLTDAVVSDLAGASGGKAVHLDWETSRAVKEVILKAGKYEAVIYAQAPDEDQDAFFLAVAGGAETRLFPDDPGGNFGMVLPTAATPFEVQRDGAVKFELRAAETGVYLDRMLIRPVK